MFALRPARLSFLFSPQAFLFSGKFPSRTLVPVHNNSIRCHWNRDSDSFLWMCLSKSSARLCSSPHSFLSPQHWPVSTMGFSFSLSWLLSFSVLFSNYNDKDDVQTGKSVPTKLKMEVPHPKVISVNGVHSLKTQRLLPPRPPPSRAHTVYIILTCSYHWKIYR